MGKWGFVHYALILKPVMRCYLDLFTHEHVVVHSQNNNNKKMIITNYG